MRRREFIAGLGSGATAAASAILLPLVAGAQQTGLVRRIGVLSAGIENVAGATSLTVFRDALKTLGWIEGANIRIDVRYGADSDRLRLQAEQLVRGVPEVIVTVGGAARRAVLQQTRIIPIVMAADADPVATGVVASIARPDGNITGFAGLVPSIGGKWVELLKEVAPGLRRIAIVLIADDAESTYLPSIEAAAAPLGVQAIRIPVRAQYWERLTTRLSKS